MSNNSIDYSYKLCVSVSVSVSVCVCVCVWCASRSCFTAAALLLYYCLTTDRHIREAAGWEDTEGDGKVAHALLLLLTCCTAAAYVLYRCCFPALLHTDTFERQRAGKTLKAMEKSLMSWETDANETLNDWQVALLLLLYCCIPALPLPGRRTPTRGKKICVCAYI